MKRTFGRDLTVGLVVLLGAFLFTIGVFSIGSEQRIWVRKVPYKIQIADANGLGPGSPVRLAGVQVGTVTEVHFPEDPNNIQIEIDLAVDQAHKHRIREDTRANIKILTLLGGDKYVELSPGTPGKPVLPPGSFITVPQTFGMEQVAELSAGLADDIKSISGNVRIILDTVQRQEGVVGRMLLDPNFGKQTFDDIAASARITRESLEKVKEGRGLVGRMLSDDEFARESLRSIRASLAKMEDLLDRAMREDGPVHEFLDPNGKAATSLDNIQRASAQLQDFTADLKEGGGLIGRLMSDEQYAEELLANIRRIAKDLAAVTGKLNQGEGTLGGLINDPELHEDLKNVVRGVKKSKVLSWFIRNSREEGEKQQQKELEEKRKQQEKQKQQDEDTGAPGGAQGEK